MKRILNYVPRKIIFGSMMAILLMIITADNKITASRKNNGIQLDYDVHQIDKDQTATHFDSDIDLSRPKVCIYLNPSVQTWNQYADDLGSEAYHMQEIAKIMHTKLNKYHYIDVKSNNGELSLSNSIKESNKLNPDIHLALHSNAGGGSGSEIYTKNDQTFASHLLTNLVSETPFPSRGVKNGNHLYEVSSIKATDVALIEILFHDNYKEAHYIANNHYWIATNLVDSIVSYIDERYK